MLFLLQNSNATNELIINTIEPILSFLGLIVTAFVGYATVKLNMKQSNMQSHMNNMTETIDRVEIKQANDASQVEEVASELKETNNNVNNKLGEIVEMGKSNHVLLNSNMGAQLRISAVALRRIAEMTKDVKDEKTALMAEDILAKHEQRQVTIDKIPIVKKGEV